MQEDAVGGTSYGMSTSTAERVSRGGNASSASASEHRPTQRTGLQVCLPERIWLPIFTARKLSEGILQEAASARPDAGRHGVAGHPSSAGLSQLPTAEDLTQYPQVLRYLRSQYADLLVRESSGESAWTWTHDFLFDQYKVTVPVHF